FTQSRPQSLLSSSHLSRRPLTQRRNHRPPSASQAAAPLRRFPTAARGATPSPNRAAGTPTPISSTRPFLRGAPPDQRQSPASCPVSSVPPPPPESRPATTLSRGGLRHRQSVTGASPFFPSSQRDISI
ncbi:Os09g0357300, partial [Oryza sativa Japonica Group]